MILDPGFAFINDEFHADHASPAQLDLLLADGWRHFGTHFFRYNLGFYEMDIRRVIPLRIRLADFSLSKSQRRVLRRNEDLTVVVCGITFDRKSEELFHRHKQRFKGDVPHSVSDFIGDGPSSVETRQMRVFENDELRAVSYFDVGKASTSGVYAMFEPESSSRSLGIFTLLKEIEFSIANKKEFYYLGYSYAGKSFYDYKKRFHSTEMFDWKGDWLPFDETVLSN